MPINNLKDFKKELKKLNKDNTSEVSEVEKKAPFMKRYVNFMVFAIVVLSLPVTVGLVFYQQDVRQRASEVSISRLAFQPAGIQTQLSPGQKIPLSVLAYNANNEPIFDGVTYQWGISSTGSIGTLSETSGSIASFTPQNNGHGDIFVTATMGSQSFTGSMPVNIGDVPQGNIASRLYFDPATSSSSTQCQSSGIYVKVDPGTQPNNNYVTIVDFYIKFDPSKIQITEIKPSVKFPMIVRPLNITNGVASMSLSVGSDVTKAALSTTIVAEVIYKALSSGQATMDFDYNLSRVYSVGPSDNPTQNVLASVSPGLINIQTGICPTDPTPTPTSKPTPTPACFESNNPADINRDGVINQLDIAPLQANFLKNVNSDPALKVFDLDGDGVISILDISRVSGQYGRVSCSISVTPTFAPTTAPTSTPTPSPVNGFKGEYFTNRFLAGTPALTRDDPSINFDWRRGAAATGLPSDNFSIKWTKSEYFAAGNYRFKTRNDDGMRIWIDGKNYYNRWHDQGSSTRYFVVKLSEGYHSIRVEYYEKYGNALAHLSWTKQ